MSQPRRTGFAHNHALPWLAFLGLLSGLVVPILRHFEQFWAIYALMAALALAGLMTLAGEVELFFITRRRKHLLLPIACVIGIAYVAYEYLNR